MARASNSRRIQHLLVAGGAGFIGSNFVRLLLATRPYLTVTVLDSFTYAGNERNLDDFRGKPGFQLVRGSILDTKLVDSLAGDADAIINFAAHTHVDRSVRDPLPFFRVNVEGHAALCEAAVKHRHKVLHLVSTDEVCGEVPSGRAHETASLKPSSPYASSKAAAELVTYAFGTTYKMPFLITRGSNSYGPYQYPEKLVPLLITNALDDLPLPLYGDGSAVRDFLHVDDHCRATDLVLHEAPTGRAYNIYNVGTGVETSGLEIARRVLELTGKPESLIEFVTDRRGHDRRYALDTTRIGELGWRPQVALAEGLERTVEWYRAHADWWRPLKSDDFWEYYRTNYRPLASLRKT